MRTYSQMYRIFLFFLTLIGTCAHSEVIKCELSSGQIVYQSTPCPVTTVNQHEIKIEPINPERQKEALAHLKEVQQALQETDIAAEAQAKKENRAAAIANRSNARRWRQENKRNTQHKPHRVRRGGSSGGKHVFTQNVPYIQ